MGFLFGSLGIYGHLVYLCNPFSSGFYTNPVKGTHCFLKGHAMQINGEIFNFIFCAFVLFRMEVLMPIHPQPFYFRARNKAHIAL